MDTHPADAYELTREATINPPHCIPGTPGWELYGRVGELLNPDNAILVKKGTYGSTDLPLVIQGLRDQGIAVHRDGGRLHDLPCPPQRHPALQLLPRPAHRL